MSALRPAAVCRALLAALEASEGRRRRRKRDQTPDAIGLAAKRCILERAVHEDPDPDAFEAWLLALIGEGQVAPMALAVFEEWRLAQSMPSFRAWLENGAPSADAAA